MFSGIPGVRKRAEEIILRARKYQSKQRSTEVRKFMKPWRALLNIEAENAFDILRWNELPEEYISAPPILSEISNRDLKKITLNDVPALKSHSQAINFPFAYQCIDFICVS